MYRLWFIVLHKHTRAHTNTHDEVSAGGKRAGERGQLSHSIEIEVPSVKILILAETFDRNRASKCENVDFSWDIQSKSRFHV